MPIVMRRWLLIAAVVSLMVPRSAQGASWIFFRQKDVHARAAQLSPRALERRHRARGDSGLSRWLNAVSVTADAQTLAAIAKLPHVAAVKPVARRLRARVDQHQVPYGGPGGMYGQSFAQLDMLGVPAMHDCGLSGDGVVVAVLDSGFTLGHEALSHLPRPAR
jgi:hypothetical protein